VIAGLPEGLLARNPTEQDHRRVLAVMGDWWGGLGGQAGFQQRALLLPRLFFQHFTDTSYLVEQAGGELVAFFIGFMSHAQPDVAYIHFVGVDPEHHRQGLATTLYHAFFEQVAKQGARTVKCITSPENKTSLAFHTGLGFVLDPSETVSGGIAVKRDYDGPGVDRIAFSRSLDNWPPRGQREVAPEPARGETDLPELLRGLAPRRNAGSYVYVRLPAVPAGAEPVVVVEEDEGTTLVLPQERADDLGLAYDFVAAWITLRIHSALDAVGLTAAVSRALTEAGISANVVAGYTHDHLFVPHERADEALHVLAALATAT